MGAILLARRALFQPDSQLAEMGPFVAFFFNQIGGKPVIDFSAEF